MNNANHIFGTTGKLLILDLDGTALGGFVPYSRLPDIFCVFLDDLVTWGWQWAFKYYLGPQRPMGIGPEQLSNFVPLF